MCNFLSHYSLPTIDKFLGFFASPTSILKIKFGAGTDRVPAAFFKLQSLLRYGAICIEKSARFVNLEYLVDWLHYFQVVKLVFKGVVYWKLFYYFLYQLLVKIQLILYIFFLNKWPTILSISSLRTQIYAFFSVIWLHCSMFTWSDPK